MDLITEVLYILDIDEIKIKFKKELRSISKEINDMVEDINGIFDDEDELADQPSKFLFHNIIMFQHVFHMSLGYYFDIIYNEDAKNGQLEPLKSELQELGFTFGEFEFADILLEYKDRSTVEYILAQITVIEATYTWSVYYIRYLFHLTNPDFEMRPDENEAIEFLEKIQQAYSGQLNNSIDIINQYKLKFKIIDPDMADLAIKKIESGELTGSKEASIKNIMNHSKTVNKMLII